MTIEKHTATALAWDSCLSYLESELPSQQFNTWIRPLQAEFSEREVKLFAPNKFVLDYVVDNFLDRIEAVVSRVSAVGSMAVSLNIGSRQSSESLSSNQKVEKGSGKVVENESSDDELAMNPSSQLNRAFTFDSFISGRSNELARAAALQIGQSPGSAYNPLLVYGGVGLGKTHLMQAAGNLILKRNPGAKVIYFHTERFVADMVKALQRNAMDDFKNYYRLADALLVDDVQFLRWKERSQEEFFHTFNALLDRKKQIVLTCDCFFKELDGLEERLKSRLGWGLTVAIDPPELETRVAILKSKAALSHVDLPDEVGFFIAKHIRSNVRELEGALKRVIASAYFTGKPITLDFVRDCLKDLLSSQAKMVTLENIQKITAKYFKIKVNDLVSKSRSRSITRPRQLAMYLSKELTSHSLPEIGNAFGGRDHTTVLHACRKVSELFPDDLNFKEAYDNLVRLLST